MKNVFYFSNKIQNLSVIIDILQNAKPIVKPKASIESVDTKPISSNFENRRRHRKSDKA